MVLSCPYSLPAPGSSPLEEMSCSLSSCLSNLDNIQPPTLMDDPEMDNSIVSIASISSEIVEDDDTTTPPIGWEENLLEKPKFEEVDDQVTTITEIDHIAPPTLMEEVSGCQTSKTLVADFEAPLPVASKESESGDGHTTATLLHAASSTRKSNKMSASSSNYN